MSLMDNLKKLHTVDAQVRGLRSRVDSAGRYLRAQERQCSEIEERIVELESRQKQMRAKLGNIETEAKGIDDQLEKFRGDMNTASTTKQYNAVLVELNTAKATRSELDDQMLSEMEAIDKLGEEIKSVEAELEERRKVRTHAAAQLEERKADVGDRLAELEAEREQAAADVPQDVRETFDQIAEEHDGETLAPLEEISKRHREYACGACNIQVTFDQVSILTGNPTSLVLCNACGRILYAGDDIRAALTPK